MRRRASLLALAGLLASMFTAVPTASGGPGPGYVASDNVEYVATLPIHPQGVGAAIVGKYLYATDNLQLVIYDISTPESPRLVGEMVLPQDPYFPEEDVDTNGKILLISTNGSLNVVDVQDKANPHLLSSLDDVDPHTISCVLDCKYAYGSDGTIVDLREPTAPKVVGNWGNLDNRHDVTEVAPGLVLTSTNPMLLFDARRDPARPKLLATVKPKDERLIHSNLWPNNANDRYVLAGGESSGPTCDESSAALMTWDTKGWRTTHTFKPVDEYRVDTGLPTDGRSPYALFCGHWFDTHPTYRNGGLVAMAWYENGTRFFKITDAGKISEVGYFYALGGEASASYWVNDEIVYVMDYQRGLDIIRWTGKV